MGRYADIDALLAWCDERRAEAHYRLMDNKKRSVRREARNEISLFDQMYLKICKLVKQSPDVEEVRHGYWIMDWDDLWPEDSQIICSVCRGRQPMTINDDNYCPKCGAKMSKKEKT